MTFPQLASRARTALRSTGGAFDLPSILVGVVVAGILAAGVLASVYGVIPFSQDKGAQQDLSAYRMSEGVAAANGDKYLDSAGLSLAGYAQKTSNTAVGTGAAGKCYVAVAVSGSGKMFYSTDKTAEPRELNASSVTGCVSWPALQALATAAGGTLPSVVKSGTALAVWGQNESGQLGLGTTGSGTGTLSPVDMPAMAGKSITAIAGGEDTFCAVADGDVYCSGFNAARSQIFGNMIKVNGFEGKTVTSLTAGRKSVCAIADGEAYCWGDGTHGRLGSDTLSSEVPVKVTALAGITVSELKSGSDDTCAVADGDVYCWGANFYGQLGTGDLNDSATAVKILAGKSITELSSGDGFFNCASGAGKTYCWGSNFDGQLGTGDLTDRLVPTEVPSLAGKQVTMITTSVISACAVVDGAVNCWGDNTNGQLGTGDKTARTTPTPVPALAGKAISSLSTYGYFSCAVADSDTYCWGTNWSGQLGQGDVTDRIVPTRVDALAGRTVLALANTWDSSMALIK